MREVKNLNFKSSGGNIFKVSMESCQGCILHSLNDIEVAYQQNFAK